MNHDTKSRVCPFCGETLQQGVLYTPSGPGLFFFKEIPLGASWLPLKYLLKIKNNKDAIVLAGPFIRRYTETILQAYSCIQCHYIIHYVVIPFSKPWWSRPRRESAAESAGGQKRGG